MGFNLTIDFAELPISIRAVADVEGTDCTAVINSLLDDETKEHVANKITHIMLCGEADVCKGKIYAF